MWAQIGKRLGALDLKLLTRKPNKSLSASQNYFAESFSIENWRSKHKLMCSKLFCSNRRILDAGYVNKSGFVEKDGLDQAIQTILQLSIEEDLKQASNSRHALSGTHLGYIRTIQALLGKILTPERPHNLKLLLDTEILSKCTSDLVRADLAELIAQAALRQNAFKHFNNFGPPFQDLVKQLIIGKPDHIAEPILKDIIAQFAEPHKRQAFKVTYQMAVHCFQNTPSLDARSSLVMKMLTAGQMASSGANGYMLRSKISQALDSRSRLDFDVAMNLSCGISLAREVYLLLIRLCEIHAEDALLIEVFGRLLEENYGPSLQASISAIRACERLAGLPSSTPDTSPNTLAHHIRAIAAKTPYYFPILMACFTRISSGPDDTKILELKAFLAELTSSRAPIEHFNSLLAAFGVLGDLVAMHNVLEVMTAHPNDSSLYKLLHYHNFNHQPSQAILLFRSLTGERQSARLKHLQPVTPTPTSFALVMCAASQLRSLVMMKEYWQRCPALGPNLSMICYKKAVTAIQDFLSPAACKAADWQDCDEALRVLSDILDDMEAHASGCTWDIYELALKAHANYLLIRLESKHKPSHLPMLRIYSQYIASQPCSPSPSVYVFMISALAECVSRTPLLAPQILSDTKLLAKDMLKLGVTPTCEIFDALFLLAGTANDSSQLELFYRQFISFKTSVPTQELDHLIHPFNTYLRFCRADLETIKKILDEMEDSSVYPTYKTFMHIFQRFLASNPPTEDVWGLLALLKDNLNSRNIPSYQHSHYGTDKHIGGPILVKVKLLKLIATFFHQTGGATSVDQAGDYILDMLDANSKTPITMTKFHVHVIKLIMSPTKATPHDPTPVVAKWLAQLLALQVDPNTHIRAQEPLWSLADANPPKTVPWPVHTNLKRMLQWAHNRRGTIPCDKELLQACNSHQHR
ncbi:hypothetical protein DSO57_1027818 [Entomophthora muscae]|uniref:Uncharacterized protein n=1 Tax=Entomophthora muscae TaxID=34485 RepID=A0ACC2UAN3_9FUNG|nr:hypothetical protein DSO57_1027818 [Entomophthora muscae]